jgi:hypothetical protein
MVPLSLSNWEWREQGKLIVLKELMLILEAIAA